MSWPHHRNPMFLNSPVEALNLVTLTQAKAQVRVDHDFDDTQLDEMRSRASWAVMDYLKIDIYDTGFNWVDDFGEPIRGNIPPNIAAAVLLMIGAMYENRDGDVWRSPQALSQSVMDLLWRYRTPAMA